MPHNQEGESQARAEEEGEGNRQPKSVLDLEGQVTTGHTTVAAPPDGRGHEAPGGEGESVGQHRS